MPPSSSTPPLEERTYLCRPCRKTYTAGEVHGRKSCPKCRRPLVSPRQLQSYQADTLASLTRLKHQSASTLATGALLAMGIQCVINLAKHDPDFRALTFIVFAGGIVSLVATGFWAQTGRRSLMLAASVIFQVTALVYSFSVFAASGPIMELAAGWGNRAGQVATWAILAVAISPLAIALLAWHQYRSYLRILKSR